MIRSINFVFVACAWQPVPIFGRQVSLAEQITSKDTAEDLQSFCRKHHLKLNNVLVERCWQRLGELARTRGDRAHAEDLEKLVQHTQELVANGKFDAYLLANVAVGAALSCPRNLLDVLFETVARDAVQKLKIFKFKEDSLTNLTCAFAKVGKSDEDLWASLARLVQRLVSKFNAQALTNTAWAFAKVKHLDHELLMLLARAAEQRIGEFTAQGFANIAWVFATTRHSDEGLLTALAHAAELRFGDFNAQNLSSTAWSLALAKMTDEKLFRALLMAATQRSGELKLQDLANTL
eukprot:gnl/TRDRNA2_/TRDRNA2_174525_c0_seq4.p1 gnl/TRDRNA2_/TRDRNA2_174525_c0~~gnl/TRDRNA2_/TRDRNA2_174525_c0_seq4.p1  ORF type:complete len:293 (+),score=59.18 gnl/TRDRNA2_/TRDRNA2_174525_c0_seq4:42-920(+)